MEILLFGFLIGLAIYGGLWILQTIWLGIAVLFLPKEPK